MADSYDFQTVERTWQERWERDGTYRVRADDPRAKYYTLVMLPYPSGDLHIGHAKNYTLGDVISRLSRMLGFAVMDPMGWDAFGLPAENAAIARGVDPATWTRSNIDNMRRQLKLMGTSYDWSREIATCDPAYYRWNQWLFLQLYDRGLAYKREAPVNWCPHDRTVLANEQVIDGRCWRCGHVVERRSLSQWFLKITDYADRLIDDLDTLPGWPERTKTMQRNWIGRSVGAQFSFAVDRADAAIDVFTTRLDTIYGATFLAIAAEHPALSAIKLVVSTRQAAAIDAFAESLKSKSELERTSLMEKQGLFTGAYAIHPLTNERVPILVTNYVLADYGTGAVMGVPAHDERDFSFARQHALPINVVIVPEGEAAAAEEQTAYVEDGQLVDSGDFTGMTSARARDAIARRLEEMGAGRKSVAYRLRDWLVSRQRYWGTPIPIVYCVNCGELGVPVEQLPVLLPPNPPLDGEGSPLARIPEFVNTTCPKCGGPARRETDTMDTFFESSWYYLRYLDPRDELAPWSEPAVAKWMNVDEYVGGAEHAVLHLMYSRFFYKFFSDRGWVGGHDEPFEKLFHQGMLLRDGTKMSKSRGNVMGIDETAATHGVDAMRLFLLYVTPPEDTSDWTDEGINGRVRMVNRIWRACEPLAPAAGKVPLRELPAVKSDAERALLRAVHVAARSAVEETRSRRFHYNSTIAKFDEYLNELTSLARSHPESPVVLYAVHALPLTIAPFAPHIAEELWSRMGHTSSVHLEPYLQHDERALARDEITIVVQVNGKVRARLQTPPGASEADVVSLALANDSVRHHLDGKPIRKQIFVQDKLLNLVA